MYSILRGYVARGCSKEMTNSTNRINWLGRIGNRIVIPVVAGSSPVGRPSVHAGSRALPYFLWKMKFQFLEDHLACRITYKSKLATMKILKIIAAMLSLGAFLAASIAFYNNQDWITFAAAVAALAAFVWTVYSILNEKPKFEGRGGDAIRGGPDGNISLNNRGTVRAGKGGTGGNGGHAIFAGNGNVTVNNDGLIAGGDAGDATPGNR